MTQKKARKDRRRVVRIKCSRREFTKRLKKLAGMLEDGHAHTMRMDGRKIRIPSDASIDELIEYERVKPVKSMRFELQWRTESERYESILLICEVTGHD